LKKMTINENELSEVAALLRRKPRIAVLTGSGISAESGIPTFRGKDGLWKQYRAESLATPEAFGRDPRLVWEWYDWRRGLIIKASPNAGHKVLAGWEAVFPGFVLITQNVDGLHRRAGSKNVLELHGNIWEVKCTAEQTISVIPDHPLPEIPPRCPTCGALLRPNVVWFGEALPVEAIEKAFAAAASAELMFVIGTSAFVQPAASLPLTAADRGAAIVEINPDPTPLTPHANYAFAAGAGEVLQAIAGKLSEPIQD
jgi:NAD-dependent deacetylase